MNTKTLTERSASHVGSFCVRAEAVESKDLGPDDRVLTLLEPEPLEDAKRLAGVTDLR